MFWFVFESMLCYDLFWCVMCGAGGGEDKYIFGGEHFDDALLNSGEGCTLGYPKFIWDFCLKLHH